MGLGDSIERKPSGAALTAELAYSLVTIAILTFITVVFKDKLTPFYSFVFVFGTASTFFFAITFGSVCGLQQASGLLALLFWVNVVQEGGISTFAFQAPFLTIFFSLLALIPNIRPLLLAKEIRIYLSESKKYERKVEELNAVLRKEHKEKVAEKSVKNRQLAAKYSSRNTVLVSFARGLLQAGSVREILNLLFYNLSKGFAAQQCAMFMYASDGNGLIITRLIHPEHQRLENSRCSTDLPYFQQVLDKKKFIGFPGPVQITEDIEAEVIFPIVIENEIQAIFAIAYAKEGELTEFDRKVIESLAELTSFAAEQVQVLISN